MGRTESSRAESAAVVLKKALPGTVWISIFLIVFTVAGCRPAPAPVTVSTPRPCIAPGPSLTDSYSAYYAQRGRYCRDAVILSLTFAHAWLELEHPRAKSWSQTLASRWLSALNDIPGWWDGDPPLHELDFMTAALYAYAVATEDRDLFVHLDLVCKLTDPDFCRVDSS